MHKCCNMDAMDAMVFSFPILASFVQMVKERSMGDVIEGEDVFKSKCR